MIEKPQAELDLFGYPIRQKIKAPLASLPPRFVIEEKKPRKVVAQSIHFRANYLVALPIYDRESHSHLHKLDRNKAIERKKLSALSAKKCSNAVRWMCNNARYKRVYNKFMHETTLFKCNFITLTLPSEMWDCIPDFDKADALYSPANDVGNCRISDHDFKGKLLHSFLNRCVFRYGLGNYVWKVESQENGNIHAHIVTDTFIHWRDVRSTWNELLIEHNLMSEFEAAFGHRNPNSTDIKAVTKKGDIGFYMASEMAKDIKGRRAISGRLWGCSHALSKLWHVAEETVSDVERGYLKELNRSSFVTSKPIEKLSKLGSVIKLGVLYCWKEREKIPEIIKRVYAKWNATLKPPTLFEYRPEEFQISWA